MKKLSWSKRAAGALIPPAVITIIIFLAIGIGVGAFIFGGRGEPTPLTAEPLAAVDGVPLARILTLTEDVTVTFSSQDFYSLGTNAGSAHRIIEFVAVDGSLKKRNKIKADDSSETAAPLDRYIVLMGNVTTGLTAGTDYYPVVARGQIPDTGEFEISKDQFKTGGVNELTFVFFNENDEVNTDQIIGANVPKTVRWKLTANDNLCIGNPDTGGLNAMSYTYKTAIFKKVVQLSASGADQIAIGTPTQVLSQAGKVTRTYTFPIVCDNADVQRKVRVESSTSDPSVSDDINMTVSDITWDFDGDTLELLIGYEDEDNNDIGVKDFNVSGLRFS